MSLVNPSPPPNLVEDAISLLRRCGVDDSGSWLLIDAMGQFLYMMVGEHAEASWPVSTAEAGLDNRDGSGGTPPGLHRIDRLIGHGAEPGTVFESREPTGRRWNPADPPVDEDLILTRILTLVGCEEGVNRGPGVDSRERYIYLHGTNHEESLGRPASAGCIRMGNRDIESLYDTIAGRDAWVFVRA